MAVPGPGREAGAAARDASPAATGAPAARSATEAPAPDPAALLPDRIAGYAPAEADARHTADTLYALIDGGAEVYRAFGVRQVVSRRYARDGAPDLVADIFDMGTASGAYGVYHHDLHEGPPGTIGAESEVTSTTATFWKDHWFVAIAALGDTPASADALRVLATAIANGIPRTGAPPAIAALLPTEGLRRSGTVYLNNAAYLATRYDFDGAGDDPLRLGTDSEAILARYTGRVLILVRYPTAERARDGFAAAAALTAGTATTASPSGSATGPSGAAAPHDAIPGGPTRQPDGRWAAARRIDDLVLLALESDERPDIDALADAVRRARATKGGTSHERP